MEFSIKFDTVKKGCSIIYIEGFPGYNFRKKNSLKIDFVSAHSADPGEMPRYAVFHLGLHC